MPIDVRTLCLACTLSVFSLAVAMTYVWRQRRTYPGFGAWVGSAWCSVAGMILLLLRETIPDHLSVHGTNGLLYTAAGLVVAGLYAFSGMRAPLRGLLALVLGTLALNAGFLHLHPSLQARVAIHSFLTGGLCLWAAGLTWTRLPRVLVRPNGLLSYTLLAMGVLYSVRGLASLFIPPASEHFMAPNPLQQAALIAYLLGQAALFTGLLVLNGQRVEEDLEHSLEDYQKLRGLIPICASCKKIRDVQGVWDPLETYLHQHAGVAFTHGICPDCATAFREEGLRRGSAAPG